MENLETGQNLWELCIFADADFLPYYEKIKARVKNEQKKSVLAYNENNNSYLFGIEESFADAFSNIATNQICSYLLQKEKERYFLNHLRSTAVLGDLEPIFLKVLTMFDGEADRLEIEKNLRLNNELHLNEFYHFKCKKLQKKWQEICDMTNENNFFFSSNELTFQLIRFLLNNCKRTRKEVLIYKDNTINLCSNGASLKNFNVDEDLFDSGNKIVLTILDNLPERIVIKNKQNFDKDFVGLLYLIFKNSLKIID